MHLIFYSLAHTPQKGGTPNKVRGDRFCLFGIVTRAPSSVLHSPQSITQYEAETNPRQQGHIDDISPFLKNTQLLTSPLTVPSPGMTLRCFVLQRLGSLIPARRDPGASRSRLWTLCHRHSRSAKSHGLGGGVWPNITISARYLLLD